MLADKYIFEEWDCPDTIQAALRYPGWDVVYEGMMSSSIDDGGLEFRGTEATLKIDRSGFRCLSRGREESAKILSSRKKASATERSTTGEFLSMHQDAQGTECARRNRHRRRACRPNCQSRLQTYGADSMAVKDLGLSNALS